MQASRLRLPWIAVAPLVLGGCAPIVNVQGSFFPAWVACAVIGIALTVVAHRVFVLTGLAPHLGPPLLIYPSLGLLLILLTWLVLYRS